MKDDVSHSLEIECSVSYKECPRRDQNRGFELERACRKAHEVYVHNKTKANLDKWQEASNKLARYFGQEPIQIKR
jgi:succinate dehydrogenase/fumarate reductase-like Fe-S protein